ncbi:histone-like nucleoid-structuring protein Lsr2 [Streptomyces sp. CB03238]|uniref:Lsr2 family DNA-binding protein n=1 Tax=Streptomyces sp. CB03238 TaxID=1907777 RepID=UPI000A1075FF|nr:histone-like nucleoid-structuring protein Lsr2 [Streptomyces sp. CB03238]ORT60746.1 hypothetical protein BKD26_05870 [Streptomyces sp. CB03238]
MPRETRQWLLAKDVGAGRHPHAGSCLVTLGCRESPPAGRMRDHSPEGEAIRLWAGANGYVVNDKGRIPASIREAYEAALRVS